ncbi:MAG: VOC family protein [Pseudomonadota bacterium]
MQIQAIHHVSLLVNDTQRALSFYRDLLGLEQIERPPLTFPGAWLAIGDRQLHLLELPNPDADVDRPEHVGRDRHLALTVAGLDELERRLQQAGIAMTRSKSGRNALFFRDPDGNGVELIATD